MVIEKGFSFHSNVVNCYILDGHIAFDYDDESKQKEIFNNVIYSNEKNSIYLHFASIDHNNEEEILQFCNTFGRLGIVYFDTDEYDDINYYDGLEKIDYYVSEILRMKAILLLKEELDNNDIHIEKLINYIAFLGEGDKFINELDSILRQLYSSEEYDYLIKPNTLIVDFGFDLSKFTKNIPTKLIMQIKKLANDVLSHSINERLKQISPSIKRIGNTIEGQWHSPNLLSSMYMELFLSITQNKKIRKCRNSTCPGYFEIIGNDNRKIYCSTGCAKTEAKRMERKRKASTTDIQKESE